MPVLTCPAKHTTFDPTNEQWRCPACNADNSAFWIEDHPENVAEDCPRLHDRDEVVCNSCGDGWSGKVVAKKLMAKFNQIPCPTCRGCGTVQKE